MLPSPSSLLSLVLVFLLAQCAETGMREGTPNACGGACPASTPVCDDASATCVACLDADDCGGRTPNCDVLTHACFGCADDGDCTDPELPSCDATSGACVPCTADLDCSGRAATPVCDEVRGRCVACTADTEAARCGIHSCDRTTFVCTGTVRGSVLRCGGCQSDSECVADHVCVERTTGSGPLETVCLPVRPGAGCGGTVSNPSMLPYSYSAAVTSVDGASSTICTLRDSISCDGIARVGIGCTPPPSGTANDACGSSVLHDGHCYVPATSSAQCSYACLTAADCDAGLTCGVAPGGTEKICQ